MDSETREFLLLEYECLRDEVLEALKEIPANEKWALLVSGAFWTLFASTPERNVLIAFTPWLPSALTFLFFLRWRALEDKFLVFEEYLLRVESGLAIEGFGWEAHLRGSRKNRFRWFRWYGWLFWGLLFVGNVVLAAGWAAADT